jgi:hypothetical protein
MTVDRPHQLGGDIVDKGRAGGDLRRPKPTVHSGVSVDRIAGVQAVRRRRERRKHG